MEAGRQPCRPQRQDPGLRRRGPARGGDRRPEQAVVRTDEDPAAGADRDRPARRADAGVDHAQHHVGSGSVPRPVPRSCGHRSGAGRIGGCRPPLRVRQVAQQGGEQPAGRAGGEGRRVVHQVDQRDARRPRRQHRLHLADIGSGPAEIGIDQDHRVAASGLVVGAGRRHRLAGGRRSGRRAPHRARRRPHGSPPCRPGGGPGGGGCRRGHPRAAGPGAGNLPSHGLRLSAARL